MEKPAEREANATKWQKEKCGNLFSRNFDDLLFPNHLPVWNYADTRVAPFYIEKKRVG